ncbi:hypothetical protein E8E13_003266 [Curvularia kusanoi]|uniref:Uncharacterized protein n=1 Tax=Curvularia kusanoi TaxID=90978 RepID=A0A9P4TAS5_CURKU|nr:hypothetical protein E8E13_003266 [Curvularia kusanoi]
MLLIQPRKRAVRATFDEKDHATSHPASWQSSESEEVSGEFDKSIIVAESPASSSIANNDHAGLSKASIATLTLEQLQALSAEIADRIQTKQRFNNTPLRRIILAQQQAQSHAATHAAPVKEVEEDALSQTSTLAPPSVFEELRREPAEVIQRRYNDTPLRRILSRQSPASSSSSGSSAASSSLPSSEPPEIRKKRFNNTPLRRILSRQTTASSSVHTTAETPLSPTAVASMVPVPRSNTPLRRILERQTSHSIAEPVQEDNERKTKEEEDDRADSVIDPASPNPSRSRNQEEDGSLWGSQRPQHHAFLTLNAETEIRAWEERVWAKSTQNPSSRTSSFVSRQEKQDAKRTTTVTVTELGAGDEKPKMPKRIVVDSKGSPLRRILQRQTSREWRAVARV